MTNKTNYHTLRGTAYWAKVFTPDDYNGVKTYKINIVPETPDDMQVFKNSGVRTQIKKNENNEEFIVLKRPEIGKEMDDGTILGGGQPLVLDIEKKPFDKLIGNGSLVEVLFTTFTSKMGIGHRLETVMVLKHIPYEPEDKEETAPGALSYADRPGAKKVGAVAVDEEGNRTLAEVKLPF